jgi:type I restriction enzyme M protein
LAKHSRELSYTANFSAFAAVGRSDAEFFQPHCLRLRERIREAGGKMIGEYCPEPSRGVQPEFAESGTVLALDSKSIRPHGVEPSSERVTQAFYDSDFATKGRVRKGDVLLNSTGRGTLGRAGCYQLDAPAVCDNHVAILRPDPKVCHPRYLALFLNSPAGLTQSEQYQTGSSGQLEIYPQHIRQFLILLPRTKAGGIDLAWQEKLATKVETATHAREKAKSKLAEAKRLVEAAIEQT